MNFLGGSVRIGRWFDVEVRVHMLFFVFMAYQIITASDLLFEVTLWTMLFGTVLIHEYGHCFGARSVGGSAHNILMWPLGGLAFASAPMRAWPQFVTVACGPLVNVVFCIVSAATLITSTQSFALVTWNPFDPFFWNPDYWQSYVHVFYRINYLLLLFNLLPVYPLDGGQLFQTMMWPFIGLQKSMRLACQVGIGGAVVFGIYGIQNQRFMLVGIALFAGFTSYQRLKMLRFGMIQEDPAGPGGYDFSRGYTSFDASMDRRDKPGFWARIFGRKKKPNAARPHNPNPGGWERKMEKEQHLEDDLDRILKKVSEQGIHSLTYIERQTLQRATKERKKREQDLGRTDRL